MKIENIGCQGICNPGDLFPGEVFRWDDRHWLVIGDPTILTPNNVMVVCLETNMLGHFYSDTPKVTKVNAKVVIS